MGKKNLNPAGLVNELKGGSSFFPTKEFTDPPLPQTLENLAPNNIGGNPVPPVQQTPPVQPASSVPFHPPFEQNVHPSLQSSPIPPGIHPSYLNAYGRRKIKSRHPFDIYEDQLDSLKKLSYEEKISGGLGSMSAMVREAIDDFLKKRASSK